MYGAPQIQLVDARLYAALGIHPSDRAAYKPILAPLAFPVVPLELEPNGEQYIAAFDAPPVVGQSSMAQVFNPAASGVDIYLQAVQMRGEGTVQPRAFRHHNATVGGPSGLIKLNKGNAAGPVAAADIRIGSSAAPPGNIIGHNTAPIDIDRYFQWAPGFRLVLTPGFGFFISTGFNTNLFGWFEWKEVRR